MKIRLASDIHFECWSGGGTDLSVMCGLPDKVLPELPTDSETVLVLAGDMCQLREPYPFLNILSRWAKRFHHVIWVMGNHEYYGSEINTAFNTLEAMVTLSNITVVGDKMKTVDLGDTRFLCGTLWTDYGNECPKIMGIVKDYLNDYNHIRISDQDTLVKIGTNQLLDRHVRMRGELYAGLEDAEGRKVCVVTHHVPSFDMLHPQYKLDADSHALNCGFASDMNWMMKIAEAPKMWLCGHTHKAFTGKIGNTWVACNPHGYPNENAVGEYDPTLMWEL